MQLLTIIETPYFTQQIKELLTDEVYIQLQVDLLTNPERGDLIQGTGGVRKTRCKLPNSNKGKSGGIRIIYYYTDEYGRIYFLMVYTKSKKISLTDKEKSMLRQITTAIKQELKNG